MRDLMRTAARGVAYLIGIFQRWWLVLWLSVLTFWFLDHLPVLLDLRPEFRETLRLSIAFLLAATLPYMLLAFIALRLLDLLGGVKFKDHFNDTLKKDPRALARYLGMRILAVCVGLAIVVGNVLASVRF